MRTLLVTLMFFTLSVSAQRPRLVVNIVVSQLGHDAARRWAKSQPADGLKRFEAEGAVFADARYDFMPTTTAAGLATLTTGADPNSHGLAAERWVDPTTGTAVSLIDDNEVYGLGCDAGKGAYSSKNIVVQTLGDRLLQESPGSRVVTVAAWPLSAVVMGGKTKDVYWLDEGRGCWSTSSGYADELPRWIQEYNDRRSARQWLEFTWNPLWEISRYNNKESFSRKVGSYSDMASMPVGNTLVAEFAKLAVENEGLGQHEGTDMLNICFDALRRAEQKWGLYSTEAEDCFYRLDVEIASLLDYLHGKLNLHNVLVVVTSDHGAAPAREDQLFNASQFKVILNGFLNAQFGEGDWVADYADRQLYLNRALIFQKGLSLGEVQQRAAAFALQFRGVSHVLTSTAMSGGYFGGGYAQKMQNGFYPRRGGDLMLNLMPGWVEEQDGVLASGGSMYDYDTHVPLWVLGGASVGTVSRPVNMRDVAPTLARMMGISRPSAAEGDIIDELM